MSIGIRNRHIPNSTHDIYDVTFFDDQILTVVTPSSSVVNSWISEIESFHHRRLHRLIVGLDVEWRPSFSRQSNPVAILQLCVGRRCLIFQLIHASRIPDSLAAFLLNEDYTFVGVGIQGDAKKLEKDYGLEVYNMVDLKPLAASELGNPGLRYAGLKTLARVVLEKEVDKPRDITLSAWDNLGLSLAQVLYACLDSFLSFEIGRVLNASDN